MKWYKVHFNKIQFDKGKHKEIIRIFKDITEHYSKDIRDVTLYSSIDSENYFLYFTPFCMGVSPIRDLIDAYEAEPCGAPFKTSVKFISGDPNSFKLLRK